MIMISTWHSMIQVLPEQLYHGMPSLIQLLWAGAPKEQPEEQPCRWGAGARQLRLSHREQHLGVARRDIQTPFLPERVNAFHGRHRGGGAQRKTVAVRQFFEKWPIWSRTAQRQQPAASAGRPAGGGAGGTGGWRKELLRPMGRGAGGERQEQAPQERAAPATDAPPPPLTVPPSGVSLP